MKRILCAVCLFALCENAQAEVIIGNSVTGPYATGTNIGTKSVGFRTGPSELLLEDIQVALGGTVSAGGTLTFTLNADDNGVPGVILATIGSQTVPSQSATAPYTITPAQPLLLKADTVYWIQAVFPASGASPNWDALDPATAPTSPSGLATFIRYDFNGSTSSTFNAIVVDGSIVLRSSGTAARAILQGSRTGVPSISLDQIDSGFGADTGATAFFDHVGWSSASGILPATGPRVGAYVSTANGNALNGVGTGGARGIAFSKYRNDTGTTQSVAAIASLDGEFPEHLGHATAAVYVFYADEFLAAIDASGKTMHEFLLGGDTLDDYRSADESRLSLKRLLSPAVVIADQFLVVAPTTSLPANVGPSSVPVAAGQSIIVMFDVSAYSPPGATVHFIKTLKPAPGFMANMTPVGPSTPEPPAAASLVLAPAATTNAITTPLTVTATATTAFGAPVPNTLVFFEITAGPNAQPLGPAMTDAHGQTSFTYPGGSMAGTDEIRANIETLQSNVAQVTWTAPGPLDHISISPASATIGAGTSQSYTALALDVFNNSIGDVTSATTFTISPDGSCTGATCTANVAGTHTVTAVHSGRTATATLEVTGTPSAFEFQGFFEPVEMSSSDLVVWNTARAGQAVPIKWLLTLDGTPVSDAASFAGLSSNQVACSSGVSSIDDAIEQAATGGSGLQYNGAGYWQFNWETLKSYKNSCRAVVVRFSDGTTSPAAMFKFK